MVFHPNSSLLDHKITRILASSLVSICHLREDLENSLIIQIQKQLFIASSEDSAIEKGFLQFISFLFILIILI